MFQERLIRSRGGRGILFCGAGFSADALNFEHSDVGAGSHLLAFLNKALRDGGHDSGFKELKNAAEFASQKFGEHGLMNRLIERYEIKNVGIDLVEICKFPWEKIYTTNYDNAIEISLTKIGIKHKSYNNTDEISSLQKNKTPVIHIHGYIKSWTINNFSKSCILTSESYYNLGFIKNWLDIFRQDVDRAEILVFIGFNSNDFHLNEVLRDVSGAREKVFFINREASEPDIDVRMTQSRFGSPMYIGRAGFGERIRATLEADRPLEPALSSFDRFRRIAPAVGVPSTKSIENLFLFGDIDESQLARDIDGGLSDYRISRSLVDKIIESVTEKAKVVLISGDICDGKTLIAKEISRRLDVSRDVFVLRVPYDDILDEVSRILDAFPNSALIIESCFDISREKLVALARQVDSSDAILFLSSRNIAAEARPIDLAALRGLNSFQEFQIERMDDSEAESLISLADQIAGWREFDSRSLSDRQRFVKHTCGSSLPSFLLRLLHSDYVRGRYKEEFNKIDEIDENERRSLIAALYIAHIGEKPTTNLLSDIFQLDIGGLIHRLSSSSGGLQLLRLRGQFVETVPSIGATNILKELVSDEEIVYAVVECLRRLSESGSIDNFRRHIFSQMMRYSIIKPVVGDERWINRFFDNVSKIEYMRRQVLFWLQWSIALREQGEFVDAEKNLHQAYREADLYEKKRGTPFDRRQLDDVKAKFFVARATSTSMDSASLFRDIKASCEIVARLLKLDGLTHHPFETVAGISKLFAMKESSIDTQLRGILRTTVLNLIASAEQRVGSAPAGYQASMAAEALSNAKARIS